MDFNKGVTLLIKDAVEEINSKNFVFKPLNSSKTSTYITCDLLDNASHKLISYTHKIQTLCLKYYLKKCEDYHDKYSDSLHIMAKFVGEIDVIKSGKYYSIVSGLLII